MDGGAEGAMNDEGWRVGGREQLESGRDGWRDGARGGREGGRERGSNEAMI